jgi:trimethylamine--corrinoid protein Co-methyltransferase
MLSRSECEEIQGASIRILERSGAIVRSAEALDLLKGAGAKVVEKDMRVFFTEAMTKEALRTAQRAIVLGARNPKHDLKMPNEGFPFISTDGFAVQIRDSSTGEKRSSTREDLRKWATLADATESVDLLWPSVGAADMPPHLQLVGGLRTCYESTEKHVQYQAFSGKEAKLEIEMAQAVAGGEGANRKRPHFSSIQCIVAPLQYDEGSTDALIEFARAGIPVVAMSMVSPGITGPTTFAGSVALANAEVLGSLVISQLAESGAPLIYCFVCAPLDMRSGGFATGSPEYGVLSVAGAEMARYHKLPSMMGGMGTSAKSPGVQVGFEKAISTMPVALAGCDLMTGGGGLCDASFMSMEQMLIDSQIWDDIRRSWQGMDVNESELAMDVIEKIGPKGQYLAHPHTFSNFRRLHVSKLSDRSSYMAWEATGKKDMVSTVGAEVQKILSTHEASPLSSETRKSLGQIEERAKKMLA